MKIHAPLIALAFLPRAAAEEIVPAGSINDAIDKQGAVLLVEDEPSIASYAGKIQKTLFPGSRTLRDREAAEADLSGKNLIVYGTPAHAWLERHAARLPFAWKEDGSLEIEGRKFQGERLRVVCAVKNPQDPARRAVLYVAARPGDVVDINAFFHGPTEWIVADGRRALASGSFRGGPLAPDVLRADLEHLAHKIREVHPATAKGLTPELEKAIERARAALDAPMPRADLWRILAPVLVVLRDGHSAMAPPFSGEKLDLSLEWLAEGLVIGSDAGELRRGDRVAAVAGKAPAELQAALEMYVPAENPHWIRASGESMLLDLGVLRALGVASKAPVAVRVERDGKELDLAAGVAAGESRPEREPWVRFTVDPERDLAVFTLDACTVDSTYRSTLDRFFREVYEKKIGRVAVDLRRNGGGSSRVVDEFLRYVVDEYTNFGCDIRGSAALEEKRGLVVRGVESHPPSRRRQPAHDDPPPFRGEILVITGKHTFSSANWFACVVQDNALGKVVGEPTGNAPSSCGDILAFTLPGSGLSFTLSHKRWIRPDPKRDPAGAVTPDLPVARTRADVRDGRDPVLERLRAGR